MTSRSSFRDQYQNQVAQLGVTENGEELPEEERVTDDVAQQAAIGQVRLRICEYAKDAAEALDLMETLGISPEQQQPDEYGNVPGLPLRVYAFSSRDIS